VENIIILCAFLAGFQVTERTHIIRMPVARIRQDARELYEVVANENDTRIYNKTNIRNSVFVIFLIHHDKQNFKKNSVDYNYKEK